MRLRSYKPSPAMLVALIALFVALGGSSYAALQLAPKSVGTKQLKQRAVTGPKVKPGSLRLKHFRAADRKRLRGERGPRGRRGQTGATGATGAVGAAGPGAWARATPGIASYTVPAGVSQLVVTAIGGGGGGGAADGALAGGGGGAGARVRALIDVTPGAVLTVAVGLGGPAGASAGAVGLTGTASSVAANSGATLLVIASGGQGGGGAADPAPGGDGGAFTTAGVALDATRDPGLSSTGPNCGSGIHGLGGEGGGTPGTAGAGGDGQAGACLSQEPGPTASGRNGAIEILPVVR